MRKHGWELPYHPLQVVAVAVFLALGFVFYVFFVPFVGNKVVQFCSFILCLYTPLITRMFCLYIWCASADPADPCVFKSKKYLRNVGSKHTPVKESTHGGESTSSRNDTIAREKHSDERSVGGGDTLGENLSIET